MNQQMINIELMDAQMIKLGLSAYRISKATENSHVYPCRVSEATISKMKSGAVNVPRINTLRSLGLILEVPWKNLILD